MRVLVTGCRGYIDKVMAPMLAGEGHDVVGVDTDLHRWSTYGARAEAIRTIVATGLSSSTGQRLKAVQCSPGRADVPGEQGPPRYTSSAVEE